MDIAGARAGTCKRTERADRKRPFILMEWNPSPPPCWSNGRSDQGCVTFYKRDELTTDLICSEVRAANRDWFFHEEAQGWQLLLNHLAALPGFNADWFAAVSQPPFKCSKMIAYQRL